MVILICQAYHKCQYHRRVRNGLAMSVQRENPHPAGYRRNGRLGTGMSRFRVIGSAVDFGELNPTADANKMRRYRLGRSTVLK